MASEHDDLIAEYQKYKDDLVNYEKEVFLYESKIEEYGKQIQESLGKLNELGVEVPGFSNLITSDGKLDLGDEVVVKEMIHLIYDLYKNTIKEGMDILKSRKS